MRLYPPIYPEDGMLQPGTFPGGEATDPRKAATSASTLVRSNIGAGSIPEAEATAQEHQTKAARGVWRGSKLKPYLEALVRKLALGGPSELEKYLAASQNLADLEDRILRYQTLQSRHL
jgi:guanyl-specific ribonuclease Sa